MKQAEPAEPTSASTAAKTLEMGGDRCFQLATIHRISGSSVDPGADHRLEFNQAGSNKARAPPGLGLFSV